LSAQRPRSERTNQRTNQARPKTWEVSPGWRDSSIVRACPSAFVGFPVLGRGLIPWHATKHLSRPRISIASTANPR
jgi:hypothetical protein